MLDKADFLNLPQENKPLIKDSIWEHLKFLSKRKSDGAVKSAQATFNKFKAYCNKSKLVRIDQVTIKALNGFVEFLDCSPKTKKSYGCYKTLVRSGGNGGYITQEPRFVCYTA